MDRLEAYYKIHEYFSRPGAKISYDTAAGVCVFRTLNGDRCAIGVFIPDDLYTPNLENDTTEEVLDLLGITDFHTKGFLRAAQHFHDTADSVSEFLNDLDNYAMNMGMVPPLPPTSTSVKAEEYASATV